MVINKIIMSSNLSEISASFNVFSNMPSKINPPQGLWPISLALPDPSLIPAQPIEKLPSIFQSEGKKKCKTVTACPHTSRKHYAKNMCNNCYHRLGRDKFAWKCEHSDRKHYAKGKCQFCYLKHYNKSRADFEKVE